MIRPVHLCPLMFSHSVAWICTAVFATLGWLAWCFGLGVCQGREKNQVSDLVTFTHTYIYTYTHEITFNYICIKLHDIYIIIWYSSYIHIILHNIYIYIYIYIWTYLLQLAWHVQHMTTARRWKPNWQQHSGCWRHPSHGKWEDIWPKPWLYMGCNILCKCHRNRNPYACYILWLLWRYGMYMD